MIIGFPNASPFSIKRRMIPSDQSQFSCSLYVLTYQILRKTFCHRAAFSQAAVVVFFNGLAEGGLQASLLVLFFLHCVVDGK